MIIKSKLIVLAMSSLSALSYADDLIISEYIEGSSNNKAIELYNPTDSNIDLEGYQLQFYFNGATTSGSNIELAGIIAAGETFVIADDNASSEITELAQQISSVSFFNGDDAIVLIKSANVIDSLGQVGFDPGSQWGSGDLSTQNNTLRRNTENLIADINTSDVVDLNNWQGFPQDDFSDLGTFNDNVGDITDPVELICGATATPINRIQGIENESPLEGQQVTVEAIVSSDQQIGLDGFYLQMSDVEADTNPLTSEGIFVYTASTPIAVNVGDRIRLNGEVKEYYGFTQLTNISASIVCATEQSLPSMTPLTLPMDEVTDFEAYESMLVSFNQSLVVNSVYNLGRYGEVELASQRHFTGTQVATPGDAANAIMANNLKDRIILDDATTTQNPEIIPYPAPALSANNSLRSGDSVSDLTGVVHYSFNEYRIMPTMPVNVIHSNPRIAAPQLGIDSDLKVASFNVLNYFNGDGQGSGFPTARGADSEIEFKRQRAKILAAMTEIDADIFALMEIENDGFNSFSAIADLVNGLNTLTEDNRYAYIRATNTTIGTDAIAVALVYQPAKVTPSGEARILTSANSPVDELNTPLFNDQKNRPMLTQLFNVNNSEEQFVVAVNHLKSKGSSCENIGDADLDDGQGNCNLTRTRATMAIATWIEQQYPEQKVLILGDLNAYAKEDPLSELAANGYSELFDYLSVENAYSYVYAGAAGQLDHALANQELVDNVVEISEWHINTDEPTSLDYNQEYKSAAQLIDYYADDAYRSSDHDPILIALQFSAENLAPVASFNVDINGNEVTLVSTSNDEDVASLSYQWELGDGTLAFDDSLSHIYQQNGQYNITLTVTDTKGLQHSRTQTINIDSILENIPPVAHIYHLNLWFFDLFVSKSYDQDGTIATQKWIFNDGSTSTRRVVIKKRRSASSVELIVTDNDAAKTSTRLTYR